MTVRRSLAFAFVDKTIVTLTTLATMAVVSRVLGPAEVGLFIVAITVVLLVETFRDFGVAAWIIQEPEVSPTMVRTAFTVMALMSAVVGGSIFLSAGAIAAFYGEPRLAGLIRIATTAFLFAPFGTPLLALLRRDLDFGAIARIDISAALVSMVASIALAASGFGAASLVCASVLVSLTTTIGAIWARPAFWVFRPCLADWRRAAHFGVWSCMVTLLGLVYDTFPRLMLGRLLGFGAVGLFTRAMALTQMPERLILSAVQPVVLPALAAQAGQPQRLSKAYLLGLSFTCVLQWPALATLALMTQPVVLLLFGPQWLQVVPLARLVALASLCLFPAYMAFPVLVAVGRVRDMALASIITLPICMVLMTVAATWGLEAVAYSMFLTGPLQIGVTLWFIGRHVPVALADLMRICRQGAIVTACTIALPLIAVELSPEGAALGLPWFASAVAGAAAGWIIGLKLADHPLAAELASALNRVRQSTPWPRRQLE